MWITLGVCSFWWMLWLSVEVFVLMTRFSVMLLIGIWNSRVTSELNNAFLFLCESLWESVPFDGCSGCQWKPLYWWQDFDWEKKWKLGQPKKVALPISRSKLNLEAREIPSIKRWDSWKDQQNKISKTRSGCNYYITAEDQVRRCWVTRCQW
jgi:hypothetical protein